MTSSRRPSAMLLIVILVFTVISCDVSTSKHTAKINTQTASSLAPIASINMSPLYKKAWPRGGQYIAEVNDQHINITDILTQTNIALAAPNAKAAVFAKSGTILASSSYTEPISLWRLPETTPTILPGPYDEVSTMHLSEQGDMLVAIDIAKMVYIWDLTTSDLVSVYDFSSWPESNRQIESIKLSPDQSTIAVISTDDIPAIKLCNLNEASTCSTVVWPPSARPFYEAVFSPDWNKLALISGASAQIIDLSTNTAGPLLTHEDSISNWSFSPDGTSFAVYTAGTINQHYAAILKLWDTSSGSHIHTFMRSTYNYATTLSPTWTQAATSSDTGYIHIWNIDSGIQETTYTNQNKGTEYQALQYSPDGTILASIDSAGTLTLWNATTHAQLTTVSLPNSFPSILDFSLHGDWITTVTDDDHITLWKPAEPTD